MIGKKYQISNHQQVCSRPPGFQPPYPPSPIWPIMCLVGC